MILPAIMFESVDGVQPSLCTGVLASCDGYLRKRFQVPPY